MLRNPAPLEETEFDLVVVGAGIVGSCIAWDAALRGLTVALVDRDDFGSGASQNSLKIVHGGLRYLQRLELRTMRGSIRERRFWLRAAPHLVEPLPVVVPDYSGLRDNRFILRAALLLNDVLSADRNLDLLPDRRLPPGALLTAEECRALAPALPPRGLRGGALFHDAQMYSSERLVLEVVSAAAAAGATVVNHLEVRGSRQRGPRLSIRGTDLLTGTDVEMRSRFLVHATGAASPPPTDTVEPRDGSLRYAAALNLVVSGGGGTAAHSLTTRVPGAGRRLFFVPWRGKTLVGTAHYPVDRERQPDRERLVGRFLEEVNAVRPHRPIAREDVERVHSGLLPLRSGSPNGEHLLRSGRIIEHRGSVITVVSVKYTTARALAERVVDRVVGRLAVTAAPCRTATASLPGAPAVPVASLVAEALEEWEGVLTAETAAHLARTFGRRYAAVARLAASDPPLARRVVPELPVIHAQLHHGVAEEMAMFPADLIYRRTELGAVGATSPLALSSAEAAMTRYARTRAGVATHGSAGGAMEGA
jgi:glycerol-3-phosphate dehydrogenase